MAIYNFTINNQRAPVSIIVNDELYDKCAESQSIVEIMYHYHVVETSYNAAKSNMNMVLIPQLRAKLASYGLSSSFPVPYIYQSGISELLAPYGITAPYQITGDAGVAYPVLNGSGVSAGTVTTTVRSTTSASTSCSSAIFPQVFGNFRDTDDEQARCVVMSSDPSVTRAYVLDVMAYIDQDSQNRWRTTVVAYLPSYVTVTAGLLDGMEPMPEDDPISQGGDADNEPALGSPFTGLGGQGTFSRTSDSVGVPADPVISAVDTGLVTLYVGSSNAMQNLASFLWSGLFDVDNFKKLFTSPMDCIIGSSMLPVTPSKNDAATIIFGDVDTEVNMPRATNQYANVDCGTIKINEYWGAYLDYSPYSKIQIYLPYIGFKELNIDEVMGKTLGVQYKIDCLSGACTAFITVNGSVYYTYSGSCAIQVPLTANNWGQAIASIIQVAGQAIGGAVTGGAAGALMSGGTALAQNAVTGGFKPDVQRKGSVTGAGGWLAVQRPYVILEWPRQSKPQSLPKFEGYPANETMFLGQCRGYTKVEEINLDGIPATAPELDEIESLLKGGVLI